MTLFATSGGNREKRVQTTLCKNKELGVRLVVVNCLPGLLIQQPLHTTDATRQMPCVVYGNSVGQGSPSPGPPTKGVSLGGGRALEASGDAC
jgi:hypothetical protein